MGYWIGWVGVGFGLLVPLPQLIKIFKTRRLNDVSLGTYTLLVICLTLYLIHAIHIKSIVFTTSHSINLTTNLFIWILLMRHWIKQHNIKRRGKWVKT